MDWNARLANFGVQYFAFVFSICFHEVAHGWMAKRKGDSTADIMGRLTMNPVPHADFLGTVILPSFGLLFNFPVLGWAKPVPVNERNLKKPLSDMFWIAAAGPLANIFLALFSMTILVLMTGRSFGTDEQSGPQVVLRFMVGINLVLAFFNLLPFHPLDGGKILARFIPARADSFLQENQFFIGLIIVFLAFQGVLGHIFMPLVNIFIHFVGGGLELLLGRLA